MLKDILLTFHKDRIFFIVLYVSAISFILASVIFSIYFNIPFSNLTRDPLAVIEAHPYYGFISNIGAILWSFSTAIGFFTYLVVKTRSYMDKNVIKFILFGGVLSLILLLDDLFMLHERVFPKMLFLDEKITFSIYAALILFYLIKFRSLILTKTNYIFLVLSISFFGLSILVDLLPEFSPNWHHLFEDVPKFFGIVNWAGYHFLACKSMIEPKNVST